MKKFLSMLLAVAMLLTVCAFSVAETTGFDGEIKVWVADAAVEFTRAQINAFKAANAEYANMTVTVEPMGEGDAATAMLLGGLMIHGLQPGPLLFQEQPVLMYGIFIAMLLSNKIINKLLGKE